jgi:hypothetical protein
MEGETTHDHRRPHERNGQSRYRGAAKGRPESLAGTLRASPRPLQKFTDDALGHERFTSIERVENHGLDVIGAFHSDTWGDFRTYFRFRLSPAGKIDRLDIGQAG